MGGMSLSKTSKLQIKSSNPQKFKLLKTLEAYLTRKYLPQKIHQGSNPVEKRRKKIFHVEPFIRGL